MIAAIYQGGRFEPYDTQQTAMALSYFAIGLAGYSAIKVLSPAFYAVGDARTPMIVSLTSIAINLGAVILLLRYTSLGHAGLALSTSVVALSGFLVLFWILRGRIGGIHGRALAGSTIRVIVASAVMGVVVSLVSHQLQAAVGPSRAGRLVELGVSIPIGVLVYYGLCRLTGVAELELATRALAGGLPKSLSGRRGKIH
jgi:putative peptidoglycan lipid II flippase